MRARIPVIVLFLLALGAVQPADARERRALLITETKGFVHDSIPAATAYLREVGERSERFDVIPLAAASGLTTSRLRRADAVVFVNTSGELSLDQRGRRALLAFVRAGGGLVGVHSATDTFHEWRDWPALLGGQFAGHPWTQPGRVVIEDREHPATRRLGGGFTINEEFYAFYDERPRRTAHVLARLDVGSVGGDPAEDRPLVWCREARRGRVFYDALGHFPQTWADSRQRRLISGGIRWALGLASYGGCQHRPAASRRAQRDPGNHG